MELIKPATGLIFWMIISFGIVFFILRKAAWKPILNALRDREDSIEEALQAAEKAKMEMEQLKVDNEKIIADARHERDRLIKEAKEAKDKLLEEAKIQAAEETKKMLGNAREIIKNERDAALEEIKLKITDLSVNIAEKILQQKLKSEFSQKELIDGYLQDIKMN